MNKHMRAAICWMFLLGGWTTGHDGWADSALPLLSGFDTARVESVYPPQDADSIGELAKLVYRLRSVDQKTLQTKVVDAPTLELADAIAVEGEIQEIKFLEVPSRLVEFLEISRLQLFKIQTAKGDVQVVTSAFPGDAKPGDHVDGLAVVIETDVEGEPGRPIAVATARLRWYPQSTESTGWQLLSQAGVDISSLADLASRNRRPLSAEDGDAFYSMLAAAALTGQRENVPAPSFVEPVTLLREPEKFAGQWLRLDLETVQVTRIAVTEPERQSQLGSDHYYQIDAVGDLGNVIVKIERASGDDPGPPATFENRYPVSVVARDLPNFLKQRIRVQKGGDAVVSQIKLMVGVDAFFFRLWSYSTDFMEQHGGGEQFGPLLVAARIGNQEPTSTDPAGVGVIAWIASVGMILGIIGIWFWNRRTSAHDREVRDKRKARESEQLQIPS